MVRIVQSCLAVMVAVLVFAQPCQAQGETEGSYNKPGLAAPAETASPDASLSQADKEMLQDRVVEMVQALNNFDYDQFSHFFSEDSLKLLKHGVQGYSNSCLFELVFPEGHTYAGELSAQEYFIRIVAKSRFNVGISRPYDTHVPTTFSIRADDGNIATVLATFPDANFGHHSRSETFTFKKTGNQWLGEAPDFILSDFKYGLLRNFVVSERRFYPLYPLTDTFRIMFKTWQPLDY